MNPICEMWYHDGGTSFNFGTLTERTRLNTSVIPMRHIKFNPDQVGTVTLYWWKSTSLLCAMQLYDRQGMTIVQAGWIKKQC